MKTRIISRTRGKIKDREAATEFGRIEVVMTTVKAGKQVKLECMEEGDAIYHVSGEGERLWCNL